MIVYSLDEKKRLEYVKKTDDGDEREKVCTSWNGEEG